MKTQLRTNLWFSLAFPARLPGQQAATRVEEEENEGGERREKHAAAGVAFKGKGFLFDAQLQHLARETMHRLVWCSGSSSKEDGAATNSLISMESLF